MKAEEVLVIGINQVLNSFIRLPDGRVQKVRNIRDADFRDWVYVTVDSVLAAPTTPIKARWQVRKIKRECAGMRMDDDTRFWVVNEMRRLKAVRRAVQLFVEPKKQDEVAS